MVLEGKHWRKLIILAILKRMFLVSVSSDVKNIELQGLCLLFSTY
jgi:hypothetical protein